MTDDALMTPLVVLIVAAALSGNRLRAPLRGYG